MKLFFQDYPNLNPNLYPKNPTNTVPNRTLLFLHGMGGTGQIWRPIAAHFEDRYRVLCPDQRGHGKSIPHESTTEYAPEHFARDVYETFFDSLTADLTPSSDSSKEASVRPLGADLKPVWILGHSMGSRTAAAFSALYPEHVKGLVVIDSGLTGSAGGGVGEILQLFLGDLPYSFPSRTSARDYLAIHCPDPSIAQYLLAVSMIDLKTGTITFPFEKKSLLQTVEQTLNKPNGPFVEAFARETGRPVKILRGTNSLVYERDAYLADQAEFAHLKNVEFIEFKDAGHGLPFEKRADFVKWLERALAADGYV